MTLPPGGDLGRLLERVIAHYQPIVEIGTGKDQGGPRSNGDALVNAEQ
jgi:hypothetical protein